MLVTLLPLTEPDRLLVAVAVFALNESENVEVAVPHYWPPRRRRQWRGHCRYYCFCPLESSWDELMSCDELLSVDETVVVTVCELSPATLRTLFVGSPDWACAEMLKAIKRAAAMVVRFMNIPFG